GWVGFIDGGESSHSHCDMTGPDSHTFDAPLLFYDGITISEDKYRTLLDVTWGRDFHDSRVSKLFFKAYSFYKLHCFFSWP
ncbi:hypothetical protein G4B88_014134, partial [Cannabis sativa]